MNTYLLAWSLIDSGRVDLHARSTVEGEATIHLPPSTFSEIALRERKGKWGELAEMRDRVARHPLMVEAAPISTPGGAAHEA